MSKFAFATEAAILAGFFAALTALCLHLDARDAMAKCQERASFATCHTALNR